MMRPIWITDNRFNIGDEDYGYYAATISFDPEYIRRHNLTDDDMYIICENFISALACRLRDKEEKDTRKNEPA